MFRTRGASARVLALCLTMGLGSGCSKLDFPSIGALRLIFGTVVHYPELKVPGLFEVDELVVATVVTAEPTGVHPALEVLLATTPPGGETSTVSLLRDGMGVFRSDAAGSALGYREGGEFHFTLRAHRDPLAHQAHIVAPPPLDIGALALSPRGEPVSAERPERMRHVNGLPLELSWQGRSGAYPAVVVYRADPLSPALPKVVHTCPRFDELLAFAQFQDPRPTARVVVPGSTFTEPGVYAVVLITLDRSETMEEGGVSGIEATAWQVYAGAGVPVFVAVE